MSHEVCICEHSTTSDPQVSAFVGNEAKRNTMSRVANSQNNIRLICNFPRVFPSIEFCVPANLNWRKISWTKLGHMKLTIHVSH